MKEYPEVEKVVTKIGSGEIPTDPMPMEASDLMVILKPKEEWTSAKTFNEKAICYKTFGGGERATSVLTATDEAEQASSEAC